MGFFSNIGSRIGSFAKNIGSSVQSGVRKIGEFVQGGGVGKIAGIASKIGEAISSPIGQGVLGALSYVPVIGGVDNTISKLGNPLQKLGAFGMAADNLGRSVAGAVKNRDPSQLGDIISQGADLYEAGKGFRSG